MSAVTNGIRRWAREGVLRPGYRGGWQWTRDGETVVEDTRIALCRCGASKNKPYCDNSHKTTGFGDPGTLSERARGLGLDVPLAVVDSVDEASTTFADALPVVRPAAGPARDAEPGRSQHAPPEPDC
jgi:hypothetical protein